MELPDYGVPVNCEFVPFGLQYIDFERKLHGLMEFDGVQKQLHAKH